MNRNSLPDIVNVAVAAPVDGLYSYLVPEKLEPGALVGKRVLVPFKNREVYGYVISTGLDTGNNKYELKSINLYCSSSRSIPYSDCYRNISLSLTDKIRCC